MSAHATDVARPREAAATRTTPRPGVRTVYDWELRKLLAQKRTYIGFGCALLVPLIFIASLLADDGGPEGIPFGDYVRESGLAIPLVGLFFGAFWFFPLITALVAGDIVATEDGNGTLKTILTRSVDRWQIFVGQGARRVHLRVRRAAAVRRRRAGARRADLGLRPADLALGQRDLGRPLAAAARRDHAGLLPADDGGRLAGDPALDGHPQQRRRGRGDADAVADHAAARDRLGARLPAPVPAADAVQRLAGPAARPDRLGAGGPRRLGQRAVRRSPRWRGRSRTSCGGTSPAGEIITCRIRSIFLDHVIHCGLICYARAQRAHDHGPGPLPRRRGAGSVCARDVPRP